MRLLFDLIGAQTDGSRIRGIGRYTRALALEMQRQRGARDLQFALSENFPAAAADLRLELQAIAPDTHFASYQTPHTQKIGALRDAPERLLGDAIVARSVAAQEPDIYFASSLFECWKADYVCSDFSKLSTPLTACIVYDFIPALFPDLYLGDPGYKTFYHQQMTVTASADILLAISESARQDAIRLLGVSPDKIVNISGAADAQFQPVAADPIADTARLSAWGLRKNFIFCAAGDDPRKNAKAAVEAFLRMPAELRQTLQLALLVPFPEATKQALKQQAQMSGVDPGDIVFLNRIDDADLTFLYARCALFLFPSLYEGFGLPALEAMQTGAAVLVGDNSSLREIVARADLRCDSSNPQAIAEAISGLLRNPGHLEDARRWGLARAKDFSWETTAKAVYAAFDRAIAKGKNPGAAKPQRALPASLKLAEGLEGQAADILRAMPAQHRPSLALAKDILISSPSLYDGSQRRLLIDVTAIVARDQRTGIQRVVRNVVTALYKEQTLDKIVPVAVRLMRDGRLVSCETYVTKETGASPVAPDAVLTIQPGDCLLMLDNAWEDFTRFASVFAEIRENGGKIVSCIYDLIPQLFRGASVGQVPQIHGAWLRAALLESDGMLAISKTVAEELAAYSAANRLPMRKNLQIGWFHCGSDVAASDKGDVSPAVKRIFDGAAPVFLVVGTLEPRKGHRIALEAFENLWRKGMDVKLVFLGRKGWHVDALLDTIKHHEKFGRALIWLDNAGDADLTFAYDHCAAALSPSYAEGFGLPLAEAAWRDKPIICSDTPVFREIGGDGALYFRVNDSSALAAAIEGFLDGTLIANPAKVVRPTWRDAALRIVDIIMRDNWMRSLENGPARE